MVNEFCGFKHGVIGTDKLPADTTLNNMKKADLIKLLHTAQHNYETLMFFYNNAVKVNMAQLNNNGLISCSEKLPEENQIVLVQLNSEYQLSVEDETPFRVMKYEPNVDGFSWKEIGFEEWHMDGVVLAWQPLPASYIPKEAED